MNHPVYEEISHQGEVLAIILGRDFSSDETRFFGSPHYSQQLGYIVYPAGGRIKAHTHRESHRAIRYTQEVLFLKKGKAVLDLYDDHHNPVTSREIEAGDVIFLCSGGHGISVVEDCEFIEVKQGPYSGKESDKEVFE